MSVAEAVARPDRYHGGVPVSATPLRVEDIPGWFAPVDMRLFEFFLREAAPTARLDVLELGTYLGKSAAHIGAFLRPDEDFYVCDLFDPSFKGLTREKFEQNYRAVRGDLPVVIQAPSAQLAEYVRPGSLRFAHVDASHDYDDVLGDIALVRTLLADGGVVVVDDYRAPHTPGVAAAVWAAVAQGGLAPICLTERKFYGVFGRPSASARAAVRSVRLPGHRTHDHTIAGHQVLRFAGKARKSSGGGRHGRASRDELGPVTHG